MRTGYWPPFFTFVLARHLEGLSESGPLEIVEGQVTPPHSHLYARPSQELHGKCYHGKESEPG